MMLLQNIKVPTGNIVIAMGEKNKPLEFLSLGDYGKEKNLKADFLGLKKDVEGVPHGDLLPLEEKWVVTISTQYGCSMKCNFCDVPKVGPGDNVTYNDLIRQVVEAIKLHPEVKYTKRLNIHYARMGEPTWNPSVLDATRWFKTHIDPEYKIHPVISTMMPRRNEWLKTFIHIWMRMKNRLLEGNAGLQISLNSTDEAQRREMFRGNACTLEEISKVMEGIIPSGRKITLNIALHHEYIISPDILLKYFAPQDYLVKITPIHLTDTCKKNNIKTPEGYDHYYPYKAVEEKLKDAGYDVIVFVPSKEEDESRITCGNAILATMNNNA